MSTIKADTLSTRDGTYSTSTQNPIRGSAKAWVNFNGTGVVAILSAYNVSSITDNGVGDYTVNFTTAMVDANYVTTIGTTPATTIISFSANTTTTCRVVVRATSTGTGTDSATVPAAFFGN